MTTSTIVDLNQYIKFNYQEGDVRARILEGDFVLQGEQFYYKLVVDDRKLNETFFLGWFAAGDYDKAVEIAKTFFFDE